MQWINNFKLFLFDFDGLLINSEEVHYQAYKMMCASHQCNLNWSFERYCQTAHYRGEGLKRELFELFPQLEAYDPTWTRLYAEKQQNVRNLFSQGAAKLMPGVQEFLEILQNHQKKCCVVTHSPDELVSVLRNQYPIFKAIEHWVTREQYTKPKPDSESYLKAIEMYADPSANVIGFEDTPRGLQALMGTRAKPVLICTTDYPEIPMFLEEGVKRYKTFESVLKTEIV